MKTIKYIVISLVVLGVLTSLAMNAYYFGWKQLEAKFMQKGANIVVNQIINQVNNTGQIKIGEITLIKQ